MKAIALAYLCGEYPRATDTFIQREIAALRQMGLRIETISVRRPAKREQGSAEQEAERRSTYYLLPCSPWRLLLDHIKLFCSMPRRYLQAFRLALQVRAPGLRALIYQIFYFAEAGMVAAHMQRLGIRHVHNHAPDSSGYVTLLAAELAGLTYSITIHGFGILGEPTRWRLREKIQKALFVICVSQYARSQAMLWSHRSCWSRIHVIHCGIFPASTSPRRHHGRGKRLLFVGRFDHVKGLPLLLEAFSVLAQRDPDVHLDLVGNGPEYNDLKAMTCTLGLQDRVTFHGYHSQKELRHDYANADIFVMTSFMEGIPVALMEAMAWGVPVVAPRIAGIPELVEDNNTGLLYTPGDTKQIIDKLEILITDADLRNRLGLAGRNKVLTEFNLNSESTKLAKLIRNYLSKDH